MESHSTCIFVSSYSNSTFVRFIQIVSHTGFACFIAGHQTCGAGTGTWLMYACAVSPLGLSQVGRPGARCCSWTSSCHACAHVCWAHIRGGNFPRHTHVQSSKVMPSCVPKGRQPPGCPCYLSLTKARRLSVACYAGD